MMMLGGVWGEGQGGCRPGVAGMLGGRRAAYRLHGVIHGQEGLQALPLQHVGELHVDGLHGPRVAHDPVLVGVGCIVVARGAGGQTGTEVRSGQGWGVPGPRPQVPPRLRGAAFPALGLQLRVKPPPPGRQSVGGSAPRQVSISPHAGCARGKTGGHSRR